MNYNDILTLEDVAQYLRVSERTIYDWAQKGKIPGGKIGTVWRFKRSDIAQWVDEQLGVKSSNEKAVDGLRLSDILMPERVMLLDAVTKKEALNALITLLAQTPEIKNEEEFKEGIYKREELMSTGVGLGVGIPHVRLASISGMVMAAGVCRNDIIDYEAFDNRPVRIIFMIGAHINQSRHYIKILSKISIKVKEATFRNRILGADDPSKVFRVITGTAGG